MHFKILRWSKLIRSFLLQHISVQVQLQHVKPPKFDFFFCQDPTAQMHLMAFSLTQFQNAFQEYHVLQAHFALVEFLSKKGARQRGFAKCITATRVVESTMPSLFSLHRTQQGRSVAAGQAKCKRFSGGGRSNQALPRTGAGLCAALPANARVYTTTSFGQLHKGAHCAQAQKL